MLRQIAVAHKFLESTFLLKNTNFLQFRAFKPETMLNYAPDSLELKSMEQSLKELSENPVEVPIAIGDVAHHSGDHHLQRMPHNWRCNVAHMSWANRQIINVAIRTAKQAQSEWCDKPVKERVEIWRKCADILANEDRYALNAAIMLGQGKTLLQAEEDTCRTINDIRTLGTLLLQSEAVSARTCEKRIRSTGGFIAAMTPYNWTSYSANLAMCPALMGNGVLWMPSPFNVLSCYIVWKALQKADLPAGILNFIPSNPNFFVENITRSRDLAGINYAGRMFSYENAARVVAARMDRHNCFASAVGPKDGKNFHFVHESADVPAVAEATALAAFDYSGQRGSSCECLFVPRSMWSDMKAALIAHMDELKPDDVSKLGTKMSAVINKVSYERIVGMLNDVNASENCEIVYGGDHNATQGFFIEPTLIECLCLDTKIMKIQIEGPVLGVYVYENGDLEGLVEELAKNHQYTISGSIFSEDEEKTKLIADSLGKIAANLYLNKPCIGCIDGQTFEQPSFPRSITSDDMCQLNHWLPPVCC